MSGHENSSGDVASGPHQNATSLLETDEDGTITKLEDGGKRVFAHLDEPVVGRSIEALQADGILEIESAESFETAIDPSGERATVPPSEEESDWFRVAIDRPADLPPVRYAVSREPGAHPNGFEWRCVENGVRAESAEMLSAVNDATTAITAEKTVRNVFGTLEDWVNRLLRPTGIDVRRISTDRRELIEVRKRTHTTPVDVRTVVDATGTLYSSVWSDGELLVLPLDRGNGTVDGNHGRLDPHHSGKSGSTEIHSTGSIGDGFGPVVLAPIGSRGTIAVGRVGGAISGIERDILELLSNCASATIERIGFRSQLDDRHAERERYETLVSSIPDPVYWTDASGRITFINRAFEEEFGTTMTDCDGLGIDEFVTPESAARLHQEIVRLLEPDGKDYSQVTLTGRKRDGRQFDLEASIAIVYHENRYDGVVGVFRDVTDRRREEEISRVMNRALRHNLRTSINNVIGYAELAEERQGDTDEHMRIIREEGKWLMKLGDRLRAVRRSIAASDHSNVTSPVSELVEPLVDEYRSQYPAASIETTYETDPSIHGGAPLQVALDNVIENALVHNHRERPDISITASESGNDDWVTIAIEDDGPGIPDRDVELVIGDTDVTQLQHGTGIGLWITRWIVEILDGELGIETGDDGTTVSFDLPRPLSG